ncbi:hypothetical protein LOTGIDRAFT_239541 [Lottia gigantea]|uniref:CABIT domain-containing protein n=1 Tax=Lottia gigantea TaxID=225164 RepID=V4AB98_LOTGI|nr:hypothetical protein LOTGIDRAFT_239541 [Lottia gigantea]ESO94082.1 hypothetical protein LOTGIDRAFT_239541 [Lottia gigantea]
MSSRSRTSSQGKRWNGKNTTSTHWSSQSYSMKEIPDQFSLPLVVRCNPQTLFTKRSQPLPVNLGQPMLLYESRTVRKLLARNVLYDERAKKFGETDETVVIPADYQGHFLRLNARTARDEIIHNSVESLAKSKATAFVNVNKLTAFQIGKNQQSNYYPRLEFSPGSVFIVDKMFKGTTRQKVEGVTPDIENPKQELCYLKCRDERNIDILIPLGHPGEFIEVLPNTDEQSTKLSMLSSQIITNQKFPQLLRYVYGGTRPRLTSYSGLFTALDSFEETSLIGCVLNSSGYTLVELPLTSPLSFQIALNSNDLLNVPVLKQAWRLCNKQSNSFASDMKFKFKFALRLLESNVQENKMDDDDDDPPSATNSARFGITHSYIYL